MTEPILICSVFSGLKSATNTSRGSLYLYGSNSLEYLGSGKTILFPFSSTSSSNSFKGILILNDVL